MHGNGGEAEMRSISETEADEPSRGRRIFQQKNICDRAETTERERNPDAFGRGGVDATAWRNSLCRCCLVTADIVLKKSSNFVQETQPWLKYVSFGKIRSVTQWRESQIRRNSPRHFEIWNQNSIRHGGVPCSANSMNINSLSQSESNNYKRYLT